MPLLVPSEAVAVRNTRLALFGMVTAGGLAALSWEVLWQLKASLALGVSALGTALTLAATMGGMSAGALLMGRRLRYQGVANPVRAYGLLELAIGLSGLMLGPAFSWLERLDSSIYAQSPRVAPVLHLLGITAILGPPTLAMGATVPLFGLVGRRWHTSIALLYGLNTLGAGIGTLVMAFLLLPTLGVAISTLIIAGVNLAVCLVGWNLPLSDEPVDAAQPRIEVPAVDGRLAAVIVFVTGFATFCLEVAWFRSLRASLLCTTASFAILLAAVLIPLALAARSVSYFQEKRISLGWILAGAGSLTLLTTPLVERFDLISQFYAFAVLPSWFLEALLVIGPPILLLGVALPWLLDQQQTPAAWGRLYALNTIGSIVGALIAAWVLLPALGFARTAWLIGTIILLTALPLCRRRDMLGVLAAGSLALAIAVVTESGVGRHRTLGAGPHSAYQLVAFHEGPDSTVSVVERQSRRWLYIDGFAASDESQVADYMVWMGRLPMLLHPAPKDALVICFGTGQTANAVRQEGIEHLDIVDINQAVFDMAGHFPTNQSVLAAPGVTAITMDGRAWLRRTGKQYDVITLEPMPPTFAGMNALYSHEFYALVTARLRPGGIVAQWLPFHLVNAPAARAIAATFFAAFPNAILWTDPISQTGILVGRSGDTGRPLGAAWPGLTRPANGRTLSPDGILAAVSLDATGLGRFVGPGAVITDDNQLLAYSWSFNPRLTNHQRLAAVNLDLVKQAAAPP